MTFRLKILGANSATPAYGRHPTSQLLQLENQHFLIDCGEGTQMQLLRFKAKASRISHIFISHLHGDHIFGLIGLINTMNLSGRKEDMYIYGPYGLSEIITVQLRHSNTGLGFKLHFTALDTTLSYQIMENQLLSVHTIPLQHGTACCGFLFREKTRARKINKEKMPPDLSVDDILALKAGNDLYHPDGSLRYGNEELTLPPPAPRAYAYCSDTSYTESIIEIISGANLLYHEATFMHDEVEKAHERNHSTTIEAATIARKAGVNKLLIGHYSSRYRDLQPLLEESRMVFPNTHLSIEGEDYHID
ncbi:MAG: ribonuclease Z [Cyclobacteriaceae bacterium]